MNDEDFEFFTDEDGTPAGWIRIEDANAKLERDCIKLIGFKRDLDDKWCLSEYSNDSDTHETLALPPRPIKKPEPECDHTVSADMPWGPHPCNIPIKIKFEPENCPKCVEKL